MTSTNDIHPCISRAPAKAWRIGKPSASSVAHVALLAATALGSPGCGEGEGVPPAALGDEPASMPERAGEAPPAGAFVTRQGTRLELDGRDFRFAGSNNYYLMYGSPFMVDDVLGAAQRAGFNTLRTWGFLDIGNQDGSNSVRGPSDGVYFQYWGGAEPAYNDGPDGLERLDYIIFKAGQLGIKLVIPLVNNWNDFGGMDQYVRWRASSETSGRQWFHDDFYTDPTIQKWYADWLAHVIGRVNTFTGIAYRDDPTIAMWELANEPRCTGGGAYGRSESCTTETLTAWVDAMSTHIRNLDQNHLISVGDEGFYCLPDGEHWTEQCGDGVDALAFAQLPHIDVMSAHLYPEDWGTDVAWGTEWISRHVNDAREIGKASLIGEFGIGDKRIRNRVYHDWMETLSSLGGNGSLYWILSGRQDDGQLYGDFDGFTVYEGTPTFQTLTHHATSLINGTPRDFPPVADHDVGYLTHDTAAVFHPLDNDVAAIQDPSTLSLDLDVATDGVQTSFDASGTALEVVAGGGVSVTPPPGYVGRLELGYRVQDNSGRASNTATLSVVVSPDPVVIHSFETGVEGWGAQNPANGGTVAQSDAFASDGGFGLEVTGTNFNWFGTQLLEPLDLSARRALTYDFEPSPNEVTARARIFFGTVRCQSAFTPVPANATSVELDLINLNCDGARPPGARATSLYLRFNGGTYRIDNVQLK